METGMFALAIPAVILAHELAHALAAVLVGARVWGVVLGTGPLVRRGSWWQIRQRMTGAGIALVNGSVRTPLQAAATAAGPVLLSLALLPVPVFGPLFLFFNALNLLPVPHSDGMRLWASVTGLTGRRKMEVIMPHHYQRLAMQLSPNATHYLLVVAVVLFTVAIAVYAFVLPPDARHAVLSVLERVIWTP